MYWMLILIKFDVDISKLLKDCMVDIILSISLKFASL